MQRAQMQIPSHAAHESAALAERMLYLRPMRFLRLHALLIWAALCLPACSTPPAPATPTPDLEQPNAVRALGIGELHLGAMELGAAQGWQLLTAPGEEFVLAWRVLGGELKRNEYMELEVRLLSHGQALEVTAMDVLGWMPDHGHGFQRRTSVEQRSPGEFHVSGVLFHMRGHWQLTFDVSRSGRVDKLVVDLEF